MANGSPGRHRPIEAHDRKGPESRGQGVALSDAPRMQALPALWVNNSSVPLTLPASGPYFRNSPTPRIYKEIVEHGEHQSPRNRLAPPPGALQSPRLIAFDSAVQFTRSCLHAAARRIRYLFVRRRHRNSSSPTMFSNNVGDESTASLYFVEHVAFRNVMKRSHHHSADVSNHVSSSSLRFLTELRAVVSSRPAPHTDRAVTVT